MSFLQRLLQIELLLPAERLQQTHVQVMFQERVEFQIVAFRIVSYEREEPPGAVGLDFG